MDENTRLGICCANTGRVGTSVLVLVFAAQIRDEWERVYSSFESTRLGK